MKVLKASNQLSLAYLTAATHGMREEADQLKEQIGDTKKVPDVDPNAKFLKPPPPIQQAESNWPLLTVSRVSVKFAFVTYGSNKHSKIAIIDICFFGRTK